MYLEKFSQIARGGHVHSGGYRLPGFYEMIKEAIGARFSTLTNTLNAINRPRPR
jgi:hypothetical protein